MNAAANTTIDRNPAAASLKRAKNAVELYTTYTMDYTAIVEHAVRADGEGRRKT